MKNKYIVKFRDQLQTYSHYLISYNLMFGYFFTLSKCVANNSCCELTKQNKYAFPDVHVFQFFIIKHTIHAIIHQKIKKL